MDERGQSNTGRRNTAGSSIHLMDGLRNAVSFGVPLEQAVMAATSAPAKAIGMEREIGCIRQVHGQIF